MNVQITVPDITEDDRRAITASQTGGKVSYPAPREGVVVFLQDAVSDALTDLREQVEPEKF